MLTTTGQHFKDDVKDVSPVPVPSLTTIEFAKNPLKVFILSKGNKPIVPSHPLRVACALLNQLALSERILSTRAERV